MEKGINWDQNNIFFRCVEGSDEAIMISDTQGCLVYVNPAWTTVYGYSREEAIGKTPQLLHSDQNDDGIYQRMWKRILDPAFGSWKGELLNRTKDGTLIPVLLTITPFWNGSATAIEGFMGMAVDLSFKRELEAKVAHQDRLASIGLLASGLAHEIGTPLGVIRGRAELLGIRAQDPDLRKGLGVITSEIDRISKLIRSLLRVSRSFSDVQLEAVSLASVVEEVFSLVGQNLRDDQVEVLIEISEEIKIKADFGRLEQVILNLIMNSSHALKKAKSQGRMGSHRMRLSAELKPNGRVELQVEDTGCGISAGHLKRLFKPFFTTKDIGEGTGLGLAIVAQLTREMEGAISVQSTEGVGTTFFLEFQSAI